MTKEYFSVKQINARTRNEYTLAQKITEKCGGVKSCQRKSSLGFLMLIIKNYVTIIRLSPHFLQ